MDFATIGKLSSYVKIKNLTFAAKYKIRTGQTITNANGNFIPATTSTFEKLNEANKAANDKAKQQKLRRIKQKLMNGRKLSDEEMGFLRTNDTKLYKKAKHAEEAREELKVELKKAKSKSEAREAMTRAMIKASTEAMAELGALGQTGGVEGAPSSQGGAGVMNFSGGDTGAADISGGTGSADIAQGDASAADVASGETSAQGNANANANSNANADATENKKFSELNKSIQNSGEKNSGDDADTPEDIMEKFIMTIRALEDEWARFTDSDEYKNLPENTLDDSKEGTKKSQKQIAAPQRKTLTAAALYRKSMLYYLDAD